MIRLSGFEPGRDIEIQFTGLRPGEKLYEELITEGEGIVPTHFEKIMALRGTPPSLEELKEKLACLWKSAEFREVEGIKRALKGLVPEYEFQSDPNGRKQGAWKGAGGSSLAADPIPAYQGQISL